MFIAFWALMNPSSQIKHDRSMAPRSRQVMLSCPSSLPGHSDFPTPVTPILPISPPLDRCLPRVDSRGDARISGPTSVIFHRMPLALPRVPRRCSCPFLPCRLRPSPSIDRIGVYPRFAGFIPHPDSPSNNPPGFSHEAAPFALCYGLRLWLAPLAMVVARC
jgi:hypothetical protein